MESTITINNESCIKCGKCVRVCPSRIFTQSADTASVELINTESCIGCGHCTAICPTTSVVHSLFPATKVHPIDYAQMPSPEQVLMLCRARRSNRAFSTKPIPTEMLEMILEAAHRAPTASNLQQVEFTLVTDPNKLSEITDTTISVFTGVAKTLSNPLLKPILKRIIAPIYRYLPIFERMAKERAQGNDLILRGATAVLLIHTPESSKFGCQDANLAYQNGSLMAESLGVNQFYTGFVCSAAEQDKKDKLAKLLDISGTIHAGMALGMPAFRFPNYIDKQDMQLKRW